MNTKELIFNDDAVCEVNVGTMNVYRIITQAPGDSSGPVFYSHFVKLLKRGVIDEGTGNRIDLNVLIDALKQSYEDGSTLGESYTTNETSEETSNDASRTIRDGTTTHNPQTESSTLTDTFSTTSNFTQTDHSLDGYTADESDLYNSNIALIDDDNLSSTHGSSTFFEGSTDTTIIISDDDEDSTDDNDVTLTENLRRSTTDTYDATTTSVETQDTFSSSTTTSSGRKTLPWQLYDGQGIFKPNTKGNPNVLFQNKEYNVERNGIADSTMKCQKKHCSGRICIVGNVTGRSGIAQIFKIKVHNVPLCQNKKC